MSDLWFFHNSHDPFYRTPFGAQACEQDITLRFRAYGACPPDRVFLRLWIPDSGEEKIKMKLVGEGLEEWTYEVKICTPSRPTWVWYYFIVEMNEKRSYYGNNREGWGGIGFMTGHPPDSYQITVYKKGFTTPSWFKDSVMYQIFADRFYNGLPGGHVLAQKEGVVIHKSWDELPNFSRDAYAGEYLANDFFGGNLPGIIEKLPYLKELGVDVVYLNPIFEAFSNHKYDTGDFMKIDPMFGDDKSFQLLCQKGMEMGISFILDGVFSHTGSDSRYFNKKGHYPGLGAYQSKESPYYPWYRFESYPKRYDCWWGVHTLPNVNEMEPSYRQFIIHDQDSVARYWIKMGARGWRMDVVDELPKEFLKEFYTAVKEEKPDAILIGEVWENASNKMSYGEMRQYMLGEEMDSVMNYPFRDALLKFFLEEWDGEMLYRALMGIYETYPLHCFYSVMNLIGSHDVIRIKTLLGEGAASDPLSRLTAAQEELALKRLRAMSLFQMTFPGVPCIYYGDEVGMEGYRDPYNRAPYPWGKEDKKLLEWYKKIIAIRKELDLLRTGEYIPLYYHQDVFVFARRISGGRDVFGQKRKDGFAIALFNRSRTDAHSLDIDLNPWQIQKLYDPLTESKIRLNQGHLTFSLPPLSGQLLIE